MKTLGKAIAAASLAALSVNATAVEGLSTTIGAVSDYYFRGTNLGDAAAYASVDYEVGGFYAGVWAIDDGTGGNDGLETDFYFGYGVDLDGVELGVGFNSYQYTYSSDFENEIVLSAAMEGFGIGLAFGEDSDREDTVDNDADYLVIELSYGSGPYGVVLGSYDIDESDKNMRAEGEYKWFEVSYSAEVATFDVTATIGQRFDKESGGMDETSAGDNYLVLDVSKGFDI